MFRKYAFVLLILLGSCRGGDLPGSRVDLLTRVPYSTSISDTQVILFGTPEAQTRLISGFADPENESGKPFQWAHSETAEVEVEVGSAVPLFLHVEVRSFFANAAEVYLNDRPQGRIEMTPDTERVTVSLTSVRKGKNRIAFRFSELRMPEGGKDPRRLAAAFYSMVLTPSKYLSGPLRNGPADVFGTAARYRAGSKSLPAFFCRTGGSLFFQENVTDDAVLEFGYLFRPTVFSEADDYAGFSIVLRMDGGPEQKVFEDRLEEASVRWKRISLREHLAGSPQGLIELELRTSRNTIDSGQVAWIDPVLHGAVTERTTGSATQAREVKRLPARDANVLVVVLDAASVRHIGCYGYNRNTTPIIDELASSNIQFLRAYTNAVYTLASTGSLMTGLLPERHRILDLKDRLPAHSTTMATIFRDAGYQTGTFVANGNASASFGMTLGFETAAEVFRGENYTGWAQEVTDAFRSWFHERGRWKWFAYLHYREPHDPFNPPEQWVNAFTDPTYTGSIGRTFRSRIRIDTNDPNLTEEDKLQIRNLYDANMAYADSQIGQLLEELRNHGQLNRTVVIVTSDHGEAFWEHGFQGHNVQLYEESIRIPLIIKLPERLAIGAARIHSPVSTVDLLPSLVDLLGFSRKDLDADGESFLNYLFRDTNPQRPIFTQTTRERAYSLLKGDYKYVTDLIYGGEELYNLKNDPMEKENLADMQPVRARYYRYQLLRQLDRSRKAARAHRPEKAVIDEEARENLKALGYIDE